MADPVAPQQLAAMTSGVSEVLRRLRFLLIALIVYRIGTHIPIPGVHPGRLAELFQSQQGTFVDLLNIFSGGALERMSIFALNIIPYISASIIMQLASAVHPTLAKLRKEGEAGRRTISQYTRVGTLILATIQASALTAGIAAQGLVLNPDAVFYGTAILSMVTGTMFLMWLGEQITERGLGNGISMLIFASIVVGLPPAIAQAVEQARQTDSYLLLLILAAMAAAIVAFVVYVERGQRRLLVQYPRQQTRSGIGSRPSSHLPLKLNMSGVIPAIFASSLLLFPASLSTWFGQSTGGDWLQWLATSLQPPSPLYLILFGGLIIFFCFFYTSIVFNPQEMADNLKRGGGYFAGIRPGPRTADFIATVVTRLTVFGSLYIAAICLLPLMFTSFAGISLTLGGTSLLIIVVVAMDFMQQLQAHLMSEQYASLMRKSSLKGQARGRG